MMRRRTREVGGMKEPSSGSWLGASFQISNRYSAYSICHFISIVDYSQEFNFTVFMCVFYFRLGQTKGQPNIVYFHVWTTDWKMTKELSGLMNRATSNGHFWLRDDAVGNI